MHRLRVPVLLNGIHHALIVSHLLVHNNKQNYCNKAVRQRSDLLFIETSFSLVDRSCTLFVLSTLLVFEHTHAVLSSTLVLCCTMVTTSTAAMGNSRYADTDRMKNVFLIRFSKPHLDRTKADDERMPADGKALPLPLSRRTPIYMCSLNFIGNIVFTLNHVHCNLSIGHG